MATLEIVIDLDVPCRRCKKPGATQNGYCLKCILGYCEARKTIWCERCRLLVCATPLCPGTVCRCGRDEC